MRHALILVAALAVALPRAGAAQQDVTWYSLEFDAATLLPDAVVEDGRQFRLRRQGGAEGRGRLVPDRAAGSTVLELSSRSSAPGGGADRAELQIYSGIDWDKTWYFGFDVKVPYGTAFSENWHVLAQCPQAGHPGSPPLSLDFEPDGWISLVARSDADAYEVLWTAPMPRGRWLRFVLGFRMGDAGRVRLWRDGRQLADIRRPLGWDGAAPRCVLKAGIYRGPSASPFRVRLDNMRLGSSYRAVGGR